MFFAQMRIALKACEKAYEQATKDLTDEEKEEFWLTYNHPTIPEAEIDKIDPNGVEIQKLELQLRVL